MIQDLHTILDTRTPYNIGYKGSLDTGTPTVELFNVKPNIFFEAVVIYELNLRIVVSIRDPRFH